MLPRISIDTARCTDPLSCCLCLRSCPESVLAVSAMTPAGVFKETDRHDYAIVGIHLLFCTGCQECIRVCPQKAIKIVFGEEASNVARQ